jgi:predicted site-specific integrase-resolvase
MTNQQEAATVQRAIDGLLTKRGLAPKLQISPRTLSYWMKRGWVPYIKIGKTVRFKLEDVIAKLNARRVN